MRPAGADFTAYIRDWEEGIACFNERRYWHAHEAWERGWRSLDPDRKLHIQAMIQAAAVFHLLERNRAAPARALARRAVEKLARTSAVPVPRIEVPGLEDALNRIIGASCDLDAAALFELGQGEKGLVACLLLSPNSKSSAK